MVWCSIRPTECVCAYIACVPFPLYKYTHSRMLHFGPLVRAVWEEKESNNYVHCHTATY